MRNFLMAFSIAAVFAGSAGAAENYAIDPTHSVVQFSVDRFGFNNVLGQVPIVDGVVALDDGAPEKSAVNVKLNLAGLTSGDATRDDHVKGPFWFNVEKLATASFASTAVRPTGVNTAEVDGVLSLHGAVAPVTLIVTLNKRGADPATKKQAAGFSATARLKRSDFGMTTALGMVGDEVTITIEALAHRAD
jgi:polyisoprenoid-binding protein YceI